MSETQEITYGHSIIRLIRAPKMRDVPLIHGYHNRMRAAMDKYSIPDWPPDLPMLEWYVHYHQELDWPATLLPSENTTLCEFCYEHFGFYYHRISEFLQCENEPLGFNWIENAELRSLHEFFVATEEVQHWEHEELIPGLSRLRQMLGQSYPDPTIEPEPYKPLPSGCEVAGIIANLCVNFEGTGPLQWLEVSPYLGRCILQDAHELSQRAQDESKKGKSTKAKRVPPSIVEGEDRSDFVEVKPYIKSQLDEWEIKYPPNF